MIRIGALSLVPSLIEKLGGNPVEILSELGMDQQTLANPDGRLSYSIQCRILATCAQKTDCPQFGHLLGQQFDLWHLGMLGVLMRCSANVGDALHQLVRFQGYQTQINSLRLELDKNLVRMVYRTQKPVNGSDQAADAVLSALCAIMRTMCGPLWMPLAVSFARSKPTDLARYDDWFQCPLNFSARDYAVFFPSCWLNKEIGGIDPSLCSIIAREVEKGLFPHEQDSLAQVRSLLEGAIGSGKVNAQSIADQMGLSVRTLNRHLEKQGVSFRMLLDDVRYQSAIRMLSNMRLSISQVAASLGYSENAAFTHAFRRWCGKTPAEWRIAYAKQGKAAFVQTNSSSSGRCIQTHLQAVDSETESR